MWNRISTRFEVAVALVVAVIVVIVVFIVVAVVVRCETLESSGLQLGHRPRLCVGPRASFRSHFGSWVRNESHIASIRIVVAVLVLGPACSLFLPR